MPDINLMKDTKDVEPTAPRPPRRPGEFEVSDPQSSSKGIGGMFKSLFNRGPKLPVRTEPGELGRAGRKNGTMSLGKMRPDERIIEESKRSRPTGVIPLPEDDDFQVNLLSEDLISTYNPRQKMLQLLLVALGAAGLVLAVYTVLAIIERNVTGQIASAKQELTQVQGRIESLETDRRLVEDTTKKLTAVRSLVDRHYRWTKFFAKLENYTLTTVTFGPSFTTNIEGSITLSATATTYEDVATQYLLLQSAVANNDFISSFSITGATEVKTETETKVTFSIAMKILPSVLANSAPTTTTPPITSPTAP